MNRTFSLMLVLLMPLFLLAQGTISGSVTDGSNGNALAGANVVIDGTTMGAAANASGTYSIGNVPAGTYTVTASVIGYTSVSRSVTVSGNVTLNFQLQSSALELSALEVFASRATRETPVAYSDVRKEDMEMRLGSQDIPMVLNLTPSVYATLQGGGAGDARVNVRGFNQNNVAIMINGVPVNDMENGWVYWSNWDGVADATSSIQMQRGLSAVNLATPSIGGTMNIITDPATKAKGGSFKQELGSGGFLKSTVSYHTGMIGDKLALGGTIVRKTGDGTIDKAWTDAWAYYFGASYALSQNNRFEFYALGAPQRHGQMRYKQNIAAFDSSYAKTFDDYDLGGISRYHEANAKSLYGDDTDAKGGRFYNENWNILDKSYTGKQYFYMYGAKTVDRHDPNYLNESENYYHKPQVNLNWFWTMTEKMRLSSTFYFSGGSGGGTGTFDDMIWNYGAPSRIADWDKTIAINQGTEDRKHHAKIAGQSVGFLRNSINRQWTIGAISKLNYKLSDALNLQFGVDWRTAEIEHAREVRDLLGGTYAVNGDYDPYTPKYKAFYNEFDWVVDGNGDLDYDATLANAGGKKLGDIINYHNTNTVDWTGFFLQGEYNQSRYSVYGMGGYSMIKYSLVDHFKKAANHTESYVEATDKGELMINADAVSAIQVKGGGLYRLSDAMDVFANFGYVEKPPILDNIIDDIEISLATDPQNEKFISTELGMNWRAMGGRMNTKFNFYNTNWKNRTVTKQVLSGAGSSTDTDVIFLTGMDQTHRGLEVELACQMMKTFRLDAGLSYGMWSYDNDAKGTYKNIAEQTSEEYLYAIKDLKVGDMPQTILALGATFMPTDGLSMQWVYNYYDRHYADWDPLSREVGSDGVADRAQSWLIPSASKIDMHLRYDLPFAIGGTKMQMFAHIFNLLDATYVQDATDNSSYNAYDDDDITHESSDAEVYLSAPRYVNFGLSVKF